MPIKKNDFVEIEFTGRIKEDGRVFDTTDEKVAKENKIHSKGASYRPVVICIGEKQILSGLDDKLEGKEPGRHRIELKPEEAFGRKDARLIQLIPTRKFQEQGVMPVPGLSVNVDGMVGVIRKSGSGRTLVDFNHPLAGKELVYEVNVKRIITDSKEKLDGMLNTTGLKDHRTELSDGNAKLFLKASIPAHFEAELKKKVKELVGLELEIVKEEVKPEAKEAREKSTAQKEEKTAKAEKKEAKEPDSSKEKKEEEATEKTGA